MEENKYKAQMKYLDKQKQLRVWVDSEAYDEFKAKCAENGESMYAAVNRFVREYVAQSSKQE